MKIQSITNHQSNNHPGFEAKIRFSFPAEKSSEKTEKAIALIKKTFDFYKGTANMPTGFDKFAYNSATKKGSFEVDDAMRNSAVGVMKSFIQNNSGAKITVRSSLSDKV